MPGGLIGDIIGGAARHIATGTGGYLLAHGLISSQDEQSYIGSIVFLAGIAWSIWQKYNAKRTG